MTPEYFVYPAQNIKPKETDRVCLIDGDGSNGVDNLALMKISAFEKRHGVTNITIIKLKHQRKKGKLGLHQDSLNDIEQIKDCDRIYASFIFTRSKPVIALLRELLPNAFIGGTGSDEYYEQQEGELRSRPKAITKLPYVIENMYPDFGLYESPEADMNVAFWRNPQSYKLSRPVKKVIDESPTGYGIQAKDIEGNNAGSDGSITTSSKTLEMFDYYKEKYGMTDGKVWRGGTRGSGYSSIGCHRMCTFCVVPIIQGYITKTYYGLLGVINWVLPIGFYPTMEEIVELYHAKKLLMRPHIFRHPNGDVRKISAFLTISDNNLPSDPTVLEKLDYLIHNKIVANLNQGMDARLLTVKHWKDKDGTIHPSGEEICERLAKLDFSNFMGTKKQMHFSWDFLGVERAVMNGLDRLVNDYGLKYSNFTVYCLSGFNTTWQQDFERVMKLRNKKIDPFMMLFRNVDGSEGTMFDGSPQDWRMKHLARWTNNKILFKATPFEEYEDYVKESKEREAKERDKEKEYADQIELFDWLTETYVEHA